MNKKVIVLGLILMLAVIVYPTTKITNLKVNSENYKAGKMKTASDFLIDKANNSDIIEYSSGNKAEMYTFSHEATEQTSALTDYRYIGANPNNYVYFNCSDDNDKSTCEVWRIIGVFEVEDGNNHKENRVKLIRGSALDQKMPWDSSNVNEWSTASLKTYLNGDYYNSLSQSAQGMIDDAKYYLGGDSVHSTSNYGDGANIYKFERGTKVYNGRSTNWTGKIALMYPSDYVYTYALGVDDTCYQDSYYCDTSTPISGWIYNGNINVNSESILTNWTLTHYADYSGSVFIVFSTGIVDGSIGIIHNYGVRPVVYLTPDIYITDGDGSNEKPYVLSLTAHNSEEIVEPDDKTPDINVTIDDNTNTDNNPQTYDGIIGYIILGIVSFGLIGLTVKKYLFR